ncbi:non-specific serine/threonine protein kinase [Salvia divinorum]|uniref:Non-specific serine/threonine protein kinase n=1 Tax=Salvia divinorum TaxID=28513 RepID=A0ABD1HC38_SALDI
MITTHQNLIFLTTSSLFVILSLHNLFESCDAKCTPSCGIIHNISYPFSLKGDSKNCGDPRFELACENNATYFSLNSHKYYVKAINYSNGSYGDSTIRLVDASMNKDDICSFPTYSVYSHSFIYGHPNRLTNLYPIHFLPINFLSCPNPLRNTSLFTDITTHCASNSSKYAYIKVGHMNASEVPYTCGVDLIVITSWDFKDLNNVSLSEIHESLLHGFELIICPSCGASNVLNISEYRHILVVVLCMLCAAISPPLFTICGFFAVLAILYHIVSVVTALVEPHQFNLVHAEVVLIIDFIILSTRIVIFPLMPEYPSSESTQIARNEEESSWLTDATDSVSLLHHNNASNFEITIA